MDKIYIEKNSVQETLVLPLFGRKICAEKYPDLYKDDFSRELCDRIDFDFSKQEEKKDAFQFEFGVLEVAMRQYDVMCEIKDYLKKYPKATVVNLGCGLDQLGRICDNGTCKIVNVDFPNVIDLREKLISPMERELNISCDLKDFSWMEKLDGKDGIIFFACGVFYYFNREEVKNIVLELQNRFPKGRIVFDTVGKLGLKMMFKKVLNKIGIKNVKGFFSVDDYRKELNWSDKIKVTRKGYMTGYHNLKSPNVKFAYRMLGKIGDGFFKMSIIVMDFIEN